jgi:hypothetical protein
MSTPMPIYRHGDTVCPQCGHHLNALSQAGGIVEQGKPEPGDFSVCIQCRSVLEITIIGGYRVMTPAEIAALSEDARIDLEATQAHLAAYDAWKQHQEDPP